MMAKIKNTRRGFTLVELMVVISIISILSSVVLSSVATARVKARDTRRISDIRQIRTALELYREDNGGYPMFSASWPLGAITAGNIVWVGFASFGTCQPAGYPAYPDLNPTLSAYIKNPVDPLSSYPYCYLYATGDGQRYFLLSGLENSSIPSPNVCTLSFTPNNTWNWYCIDSSK